MSTHLHHRAVTYKLPTCIVGLINWMTVDKMIHRQEYYGSGDQKNPKDDPVKGRRREVTVSIRPEMQTITDCRVQLYNSEIMYSGSGIDAQIKLRMH